MSPGRLLPLLLPLILVAAEPIQGQVGDAAGWAGLVAILADHEVEDPAAPKGTLTQAALAADGRFRLEAPAGVDEFALRICDAQGRILYGRSHLEPGTDLGTITLGAAGGLTGVLRDGQDQALAGVRLRFDRKHDNDCSHHTRGPTVTVGPDGAFRIEDLAAGTWLACVIDPAWSPKPTEVVVVAGTVTTVDLVPLAGARITGHLRTDDGTPAADVVLRIEDRQTTSAPDGSFTLAGLEGGSHRIVIDHRNLCLAQDAGLIEVQDGATVTVDLVLVPAGGLDLRLVCAEAGRALPSEVEVLLDPESGPRDRRQVKAEDGAANVDGLAPGPYEIEVKAPGTGRAKAQVAIATGARATIDLTLPLAFTVTGSARSVDGGVPAGLSITAEVDRGEHGFSWFDEIDASVAADGTFTIPDVEQGNLRFDLRAPGFQPLRRFLVVDGTAPAAQDCVLRPGRSRSLVVRDGDGRPVAEAEVRVDLDEDLAITATTDDQGRATLDGLPPGRVGFHIEHQDFLRAQGELDLAATEVPIALDPGLSISGQVVDADGRPVSEASIFAWGPTHEEESESRNADTDAEGRFRLGGLIPGSYAVTVSADAASIERQVSAGAGDLLLRLPRTVTTTLTILRNDGTPASGVAVRASMHDDHDSEETDALGRVTLTLPEGWWEVSADLGDDPAIQTEVHAVTGMDAVTLQGRSGLNLRGTIRAPFPEDLRLWLSSPDHPHRADHHEGIAIGRDGAFALDHLPPGRWILAAGIGERRDAMLVQHRLLLDERTPTLDLAVPSIGSLATTTPGGADDHLIAIALHEDALAWTMCQDGETVLPVVTTGIHRVSVGSRQGLAALGLAEVQEGKTAAVTWEVPRRRLDLAATLTFTEEPPPELTVLCAPCLPLTRADALILRRSARPGHLDGDRLLVEGLSAGRWWVQIDGTSEDGRPCGRWLSQVVVGEGLTEPRILAGGAEIRGRVLDAEGQPVPHAQVTILPQSGDAGLDFLQARATSCDGDGAFRYAGFAAGSYAVSAQIDGRGVALRERVVPGEEAIDLAFGQPRRLSLACPLPPGAMPQAVAIRGGSLVAARWRDGALRFEGQRCLSEGRWTVQVWADGHAVRTLTMDLDEDAAETVDLVPAGRIDVRLSVPEGTPRAGRNIILIDEEGELSPRPRWVTAQHLLDASLILPTEADGRTVIGGVAPGTWLIECDGGTAEVAVRPGETAVVHLTCTH